MAGQRPQIPLDELSKKITDKVADRFILFVNEVDIASHVLATADDEDDIEGARGAVVDSASNTVNKDRMGKCITLVLKEAGFTNEPPAAEASNVGDRNIAETVAAAAVRPATADLRPQLSALSMDVTALREQILSSSPQSYHLSQLSINLLTKSRRQLQSHPRRVPHSQTGHNPRPRDRHYLREW